MARTVEDLFKWPVRRDECYYEKQTITIKCYAAVNPSGCQLVSGTRTLAPGLWHQDTGSRVSGSCCIITVCSLSQCKMYKNVLVHSAFLISELQ